MSKSHTYQSNLVWTGNTGEGTKTYSGYSRAHEISVAGKPVIEGSSDPHFRGDKSRYNPEEMLVASLSACHMLSYLHQCASAGIVVTGYEDEATGTMVETESGGGHFTEVILRPQVSISRESDQEKALELHHQAHELCFIASSVNFLMRTEPTIVVGEESEEVAKADLQAM
jgi:organic hydroperoxide reductase OsmC/OhrA